METPKHLLVVDGDPESRREVAQSLATRGVACLELGFAREALESAAENPPALVLLEMFLPDISGLGLCRLFREREDLGSVPLVMVTAYVSEMDRILAFEAGVDDFVAKPFYPSELAARVHAILRGAEGGATLEGWSGRALGGVLSIDPRSRTARVSGERVRLSTIEFELLAVLAREAGRVLQRRRLIELVWGVQASPGERVVDSHIKAIRRKLGEAGSLLETVRGKGYRLSDSPGP